MNVRTWIACAAAFGLITGPVVQGQCDPEVYTIVIKDHRFIPSELIVAAGKKIKLVIENQDPTPEEFESHDLKREKIIAAKGKITLVIGPLKPGRYAYAGEFHEETARGVIIAKDNSAALEKEIEWH